MIFNTRHKSFCIGFISAAGFFVMTACDSGNECPAEPFDSAWIEVLCSNAAIKMVSDVGNDGRAIVEYRQDLQDAWKECYHSGGVEPRFCTSESEDEGYSYSEFVHCAGSAGHNEFRVRQGNLVSEIVVVDVQQGRCGPEREEFSVTLDIAED